MKKTFLLIIAITFSFAYAQAKPIEPTVDKRIELLSIVFRLAGNSEYNTDYAKQYVSNIHQYFDAYQSDSLITFTKFLSDKHDVGYDGVMSFAIHVQLKDKVITLIPEKVSTLDSRWTKNDVQTFIRLLNAFYIRTDFDKFFQSQQTYYQQTVRAFTEVTRHFNQDWYKTYYGMQPQEDFNIAVGCGNGGGNYGISVNPVNGKKQVFAIMGSWDFDKATGLPFFKEDDYLPTLIHEFNHSFINPLLEPYKENEAYKKSVTNLLQATKAQMNRQAYKDWFTVANESLVRASVVRYMIDNKYPASKVNGEMIDQQNTGFVWMEELVKSLGKYEDNRAAFKTFTAYYPELIKCFIYADTTLPQMQAGFDAHRPFITSISPISNHDKTVDTSVKTLVVTFSEPMQPQKKYWIKKPDAEKKEYPVDSIPGFEDNRHFKIALRLKPGVNYEMTLMGLTLKNEKGYAIKDYKMEFSTHDGVLQETAQ